MKTGNCVPSFLGRFSVADQIEVRICNSPLVGQELKVNDLVSILAPEHDDWDFLHPTCLPQGERVEQFIERAEAAGKNH